ncbi:MAG: hypothetical protein P8Y44_08035 [Acidobacteriota bacterium]
MQSVELDAELVEAAKLQRRLIDRARQTRCRCPASLLNLGVAMACHARLVERLWDRHPFIEEIVTEEISAEHRRIDDDLDLLETLSDSATESSDIDPLSKSLIARMQALLEREERVLFRPLIRVSTHAEADHEKSRNRS